MTVLDIRALVPEDLERHAALMANPDVVRYLYEEPLSREESRAHLERRLNTGPADPGEWRNFAVDLGGVLIGEVGVVVNSDLHRSAEVGYFFDPEFAGRGFATSAVAVMVEWCFRERGAHRVAGRLDGRNVASARLLQRLGFAFEGRFRENEFVKGEWTDEVVYAVLDRDWEASRSTRSQLIPTVFHVKQ